MNYRTKIEVESHLFTRGFDESFIDELDDSNEDDNAAVVEDGASNDRSGMNELVSTLIRGTIHGDIVGTKEPNNEAKKFFKLLSEGRTPMGRNFSSHKRRGDHFNFFILPNCHQIHTRPRQGIEKKS